VSPPKVSRKSSPPRSPSPKPPSVLGTKRRLPLFSEEEDETPKRSKKSQATRTVVAPSEDEESRSPSVEAPDPSPASPVPEPVVGKQRRGKGASAVAGLDTMPQEITKHGYPDGAFLLNSGIYIGVSVPNVCGCVRVVTDVWANADEAVDTAREVSLVYAIRPFVQRRSRENLRSLYSRSPGLREPGRYVDIIAFVRSHCD
jgi:hypothetical protein